MAAVQKNFVVKNGFEVDGNLIYADATTNKVGIGTTILSYTFNVNGGIGATSLTVTGVSTFGQISAGGTTGVSDQYLVSTGVGVTWKTIPTRTSQTFTATVGQTIFLFTYNVGFVDVYVNGVRLSSSDYTALDGATVTLSAACFGGENVEIVGYATLPSGISTGIAGITVLEEGVPIGSPLNITSINFVGAAITATASGLGVTVYSTDTDTNYWGITGVGINTSSHVGIGTTNALYPLTVTQTSSPLSGYPNCIIDASGDANNYTQINIRNASTGANASGDVIVTADNGDDSTNYIDFGINNSLFSSPTWTINGANDGYLYTSDGNLSIGAAGTKYVSFFTDGLLAANERLRITSDGLVGIGTTDPTSTLTVDGSGTFSGIVTASQGFISVANTTPVTIDVVGNQLIFNVVGIGSTTLTLS